jgi:hypothetical protein
MVERDPHHHLRIAQRVLHASISQSTVAEVASRIVDGIEGDVGDTKVMGISSSEGFGCRAG